MNKLYLKIYSFIAFLNLESVGSNGKEILFQSGPNHGWLINVNRKQLQQLFMY